MPMSSLLMHIVATNEYVPSTFIGVTKMPSDTSYTYQVIQFVTKLYPLVGGHDSPFQKVS